MTIKEILPPYGDDPHDQKVIESGFEYFIDNKNNLEDSSN